MSEFYFHKNKPSTKMTCWLSCWFSMKNICIKTTNNCDLTWQFLLDFIHYFKIEKHYCKAKPFFFFARQKYLNCIHVDIFELEIKHYHIQCTLVKKPNACY